MKALALSVVALASFGAWAETEKVGEYTWTYRINGDTAEIYNGFLRAAISPSPTSAVTIPSTLGGKPVMSIGDYAFYDCSGRTSVTIPSSVTSIGDNAFFYCSGLTSVTIPNSVTSIGNQAFEGCSGLTSVTIPDSVTSIGEYAFYGCSGLADANGFIVVRNVLYGYYGSDAAVTIPDGVTSIGGKAFSGCNGLTSVTIPDGVTSIGDEAFFSCSSLERLVIPDSVTSYGANCFEGCPAYTRQLYRTVFGGGSSGGGSPSVVTTVVQQVESPYALTNSAADRAIASVTVDNDCAIDSFVLKAGEVYDSVLRIVNTANRDVTLTLPSGYVYETFEGVNPLKIPANSTNILTITRTEANTFLVSREKLRTIQQ